MNYLCVNHNLFIGPKSIMIKKILLVIQTCAKVTNINMERLQDVNCVEAIWSLKVYIMAMLMIWIIHEFPR